MAALIILLQFNILTIVLGMSSMFLAFTYPFMKRITYWPQLFLGVTFNWGIIMAWTAMNDYITLEIVILYISAIFWTLGYDTIYGAQDMSEDEIIGLKSTSIKFKNNIKLFVSICYLTCSALILIFYTIFLKLNYFSLIFILLFFITLFYQLIKFDKKKPETCLHMFKLNNVAGLFLFTSLLLINI